MFGEEKIGVVIPAAGSGSRFGNIQPKQFLLLAGKPIVQHVIEKFQSANEVDCIVLVVAKNDVDIFSHLVDTNKFSKVFDIIPGGKHRQDSVWNGLGRLKNKSIGIAVVHDAVRPFVTDELIHRVIHVASEYGGAITAIPPKDTIKLANGDGIIQSTIDRERAWIVQTPQAFRFEILYKAYERAYSDNFYGTDDASLVERLGKNVKIIEGSYDNIKITTPEDMDLAQLIRKRQK